MKMLGFVFTSGLAVFLALWFPVTVVRAQTTIPTGTNINQNTTWTAANSPYIVQGAVNVAGSSGQTAILTIEPGVEVRLQNNASIVIGNNGRGALVARGTESSPIRFTSETAQPGSWGGLRFGSQTDATSAIEHAIIEYAGQSNVPAIEINSSTLVIRNSIIQSSANTAVLINASSPTIEETRIERNMGYGLVFRAQNTATIRNNTLLDSILFENNATNPSLVGNTISVDASHPLRLGVDTVGGLFANNMINDLDQTRAVEVFGGNLTQSATWPALAVPYFIFQNDLIVGRSGLPLVTLTLQHGVQLTFNQNALRVGDNSPGALIAVGTAENPIVFSSGTRSPKAGDWRGMVFTQQTDATTELTHVQVRYAGMQNTPAVDVNRTTLRLTDAVVSNSANTGVRLNTNAIGQFTRLNVEDAALYGVAASSAQLTMAESTVRNSANYGLFVERSNGVTVTNTIIENSINVQDNTGENVNFTGNTIRVAASLPMQLSANLVGNIFTDNTVENVNTSYEVTVIGQPITRDAVWQVLSIPYHVVQGAISIGKPGSTTAVTLTLEPGTTLTFDPNTGLGVGENSLGALIAVGTEDEPIIFTTPARFPRPGQWRGLVFGRQAASTTELTHVEVSYAGSNNASIEVSAPIRLTDTLVEWSGGIGVRLNQNAVGTFTRLTVENSTQASLILSNAQLVMDESTLRGSGGYGLSIDRPISTTITDSTIENSLNVQDNTGENVSMSGNTIRGEPGLPLQLSADIVDDILVNNTVEDLSDVGFVAVLGQAITHDATWRALEVPYYARQGNITVGRPGSTTPVTLTLEPGIEIIFDPNIALTVGENGPGALVAVGTVDDPIIFTSAARYPRPGDWRGLVFGQRTQPTTQLSHVDVRFAGAQNTAGVIVNNTTLNLTDSVISNSAGHGIQLNQNGVGVFTRIIVENAALNGIFLNNAQLTLNESAVRASGSYGIYSERLPTATVTNSEVEGSLFLRSDSAENVHFTGNRISAARLLPLQLSANLVGSVLSNNTLLDLEQTDYISVFGQNITVNSAWPALDIPYVMTQGDTTIGVSQRDRPAVSLTIEPGITLLFDRNTRLRVGSASPGTLIARGTPQAPIIFTSSAQQPRPGSWPGIEFTATSTQDSILQNVVVEYAEDNIRMTGASPVIADSMIRYASRYGIFGTSYAVADVRNNQIVDNVSYGIFLALSANFRIEGNTIEHGIWTGDAANMSQPLILNNTFAEYGSTFPVRIPLLSIAGDLRGNRFEGINTNSVIELYGAQSELMVNLTLPDMGLPYHVVASDLVVNGVTLTIEPGVELRFSTGLRLSTTREGRVIALGTADAPIVFTSAEQTPRPGDWRGLAFDGLARSLLDHCVIRYAGSNINEGALTISSNGSRLTLSSVTNCEITDSASHGLMVSLSHVQINGNHFEDNRGFDLFNNPNNNRPTLNATLNWWGSADGPADVGDTAGNKVSQGVMFAPWLTSPENPEILERVEIIQPRFNPNGGQGTVFADLRQAADWSLTVLDATSANIFTQTGSGRQIVASWNGTQNGAPLASNIYRFRLTITPTGGTPVEINGQFTLDTTWPVVSIQAPTAGAMITAGMVDITGSASIPNIRNYRLEYTRANNPQTWEQITTVNNTPVVNGLLHQWNMVSVPRGDYLLRLTVEGQNQQRATNVVPFSVDSITITNFSLSSNSLDPNASETVDIRYTLSDPAAVTVVAGGHTVLNAMSQVAGSHTISWNGRNSNGASVEDGAYFVAITAQDATGRRAVYFEPAIITPMETSLTSLTQNRVDATLQATYTLEQPAVVHLVYGTNSRNDAARSSDVIAFAPRPAGDHAEVWQYGPPQTFQPVRTFHVPVVMYASSSSRGGGGGGSGGGSAIAIVIDFRQFYRDLNPPPPAPPPRRFNPRAEYLSNIDTWALPSNVIIVRRIPFEIKPVFAEPAIIIPTFGQVSEIRYELSHPAQVSVGIFVQGAGGLQPVRELVMDQAQTAGLHRVIWDGRSDQGRAVNTGSYIYVISATSGSTTKTWRGSIQVAF